MEAPGPGPLRDRIFRSQPEPARRLRQHAEVLTRRRTLVSELRKPELSALELDPLMLQYALRHGMVASFPVSPFPLLSASIWLFLWFSAKPLSCGISSLPILV